MTCAKSRTRLNEIHRLSHTVEEYLYSAMEDYRIDIMIDKGPGARSVQLSLNPFTLVEPRWAVEEQMIERFAAHTRSCDEHLQVLHNLILPNIFLHKLWRRQPVFMHFLFIFNVFHDNLCALKVRQKNTPPIF